MDKESKGKEKLKNERWKKIIFSLIVFIFVYKYACMQMINTDIAWISNLGSKMIGFYEELKDGISLFITAAVANKSFSL